MALGLAAAWLSTTSGWQPRVLVVVAAAVAGGIYVATPRMLAGQVSVAVPVDPQPATTMDEVPMSAAVSQDGAVGN